MLPTWLPSDPYLLLDIDPDTHSIPNIPNHTKRFFCQVEPNTLSSFHISSVLDDCSRRHLAHVLHSFLVAEPARAFHRVVEMPLPSSSTIHVGK